MISPLAYIDPKAKIGKDVVVEPFAYIQGDVVIGDECWIGPHASIMDGARIGNKCNIHGGATIAGIPQDLKFKGEVTTAVIGNNTTIREGATVNRGTAAKGVTKIGDNCLLMTCAHVGHDCVVGNNCILVNRVSLGGEVEIDDWAIIGGHVAVHQFCRIGAHVMIGGGCMVVKDIPPFVKAGHNPLSYVGLNTIGLRRRGFTSEQISQIQEISRILYQSNLSYSKGCDKVEAEVAQSDFRDEIIDFIRKSKRGCVKQYQPKISNDDLD